MLSDEEKEAIELLEDYLICGNKEGVLCRNLRIISTIIEKQQKEIERLEARKYMLNAETGEISQIPIDNNYISKDKIKAEIEELKAEIEELKDESKEYQIGFAQGCYEKDLDWKDKIKAKIEELIKEGNYRTADNPNGRVHFQKEITDYQIEVLQSL